MNRLLLTLTLGIASCGIGWGQEAHKFPTCSIEILNKHLALVSPQEACTFEIPFKLPEVVVGAAPVKVESRCVGAGCPWPEPIPVDVPAIWTGEDRCFSMEGNEPTIKLCTKAHWSCKDRTRILLHDEQDEPKYWCRKPQTGDNQ